MSVKIQYNPQTLKSTEQMNKEGVGENIQIFCEVGGNYTPAQCAHSLCVMAGPFLLSIKSAAPNITPGKQQVLRNIG